MRGTAKVNFSGTGLAATAATCAADDAKIIFHDVKFTEIAVSKPLAHLWPRGAATGNRRIAVPLAGIVAAHFDKLLAFTLIIEDQAVAGWTNIGAGTAAHAGT